MNHPIHGLLIFGLIVAFMGQLVKRDKNLPTWIPQACLAVIGIGLYGGNFGWPAPTFAGISDWLEAALVWAAALPGLSSMIGTLPGMKTDSLTSIHSELPPSTKESSR